MGYACSKLTESYGTFLCMIVSLLLC